MTWQCRRKPPFQLPALDRGHALARGLVLAASLTEPSPAMRWQAFDHAGRIAACRGNRTRSQGRLGCGAGYPGAVGAAIEWPGRSALRATTFTAAALVEYGAARNTVGRLMTMGDAQPWAIVEEVSQDQGTAVGRITFEEGGTWQASLPTGTPQAGEAALAVLRVRQDGRQVRLDWFDPQHGQRWAEDVWPAGKTLQSSAANLALGDVPEENASAESSWHGLIQGAWFWNRWLADGEVRLLANDPFGMFRHSRQLDLLLIAGLAEQPASGWPRRRLWGCSETFTTPARMRPAGSADTYSWA